MAGQEQILGACKFAGYDGRIDYCTKIYGLRGLVGGLRERREARHRTDALSCRYVGRMCRSAEDDDGFNHAAKRSSSRHLISTELTGQAAIFVD